VRYLGDRLAKLGIEHRLAELGAVEGSTVVIGPEDNAVVFDWMPSIEDEAAIVETDDTAETVETHDTDAEDAT
jgi:GTP-binding protein